jgi:hypothetical protein
MPYSDCQKSSKNTQLLKLCFGKYDISDALRNPANNFRFARWSGVFSPATAPIFQDFSEFSEIAKHEFSSTEIGLRCLPHRRDYSDWLTVVVMRI